MQLPHQDSQSSFGPRRTFPNLTTIEPCIDEAENIVKQLRSQLNRWPSHRLRQAFNALASGDREVGLLAYYLWRQKLKAHLHQGE